MLLLLLLLLLLCVCVLIKQHIPWSLKNSVSDKPCLIVRKRIFSLALCFNGVLSLRANVVLIRISRKLSRIIKTEIRCDVLYFMLANMLLFRWRIAAVIKRLPEVY